MYKAKGDAGMRTSWHAVSHVARICAVLVATAAAAALVHGATPAPGFAASHGNDFPAEIPWATEDVLSTGAHAYQPVGSVRTVAQLAVSVGAQWETNVGGGSLMLTVASGALRVEVRGGNAQVAHRSGFDTLHELTPGDLTPGGSVVLFPRDRLIVRGHGSLLAGNIAQDPVVASVVRVR